MTAPQAVSNAAITLLLSMAKPALVFCSLARVARSAACSPVVHVPKQLPVPLVGHDVVDSICGHLSTSSLAIHTQRMFRQVGQSRPLPPCVIAPLRRARARVLAPTRWRCAYGAEALRAVRHLCGSSAYLGDFSMTSALWRIVGALQPIDLHEQIKLLRCRLNVVDVDVDPRSSGQRITSAPATR